MVHFTNITDCGCHELHDELDHLSITLSSKYPELRLVWRNTAFYPQQSLLYPQHRPLRVPKTPCIPSKEPLYCIKGALYPCSKTALSSTKRTPLAHKKSPVLFTFLMHECWNRSYERVLQCVAVCCSALQCVAVW